MGYSVSGFETHMNFLSFFLFFLDFNLMVRDGFFWVLPPEGFESFDCVFHKIFYVSFISGESGGSCR